MAVVPPKRALDRLLGPLGVKFDGPNPWDPQIHDQRFYNRVLAGGSLALGESYMDGWWDCPSLDQFFAKILSAQLDRKVIGKATAAWALLRAWLINLQSPGRAHLVGKHHYDIGNDLYQAMLDRRMIYSCAYWNGVQDLDAAQESKLDMICRKLRLKEGQSLLDIGCGWGGLAAFAARRYGVRAVGITISKEQAKLCRQTCRELPVEVRLQDYRKLDESFDRVVSVGMFEHVGQKNYRTYMKMVHQCLKPGGLFLLHTIGGNESVTCTDPWIACYIFPNSMLPSAKQISAASEGLFVMEDWHSFGPHYDKTLMAWQANFRAAWRELLPAYGKRFGRMWNYYLLSCAGAFRARKNQLWQILFSKDGLPGGYEPIR